MKRALALIGLLAFGWLAMAPSPARAGAAADAEEALAQDDYPKAFALYTQAVAEAGKDPVARASALFDRAEAYARYAKDAEALADYAEALTLSPDRGFKALVLSARGDLYVQERHYDLAIADYTSALSLKPDLVGVLTARGQAHMRMRDRDAAMADYEAELKTNPTYPKALRYRAQLLGQPDPTYIKEHAW